MFLEVAINNIVAQRLYEASSFSKVGTRPDYYLRSDGGKTSAYTMKAFLGAARVEEDYS